MKTKFFDCFMLMGTALSLRGDQEMQKMDRPLIQDVFTTAVNVSMTLTQVYFENIKNMQVQFTFLLHRQWKDPRLGANYRTRKLAVNGQIWRPRITVTEGTSLVTDNDMTQYWRGTAPDGNILYSEKITLRTFCTTNFRKFPFDSQKCVIKLGTYRFPIEEVNLVWSQIPLEILTGDNLHEFKLIDVHTYAEIEIRPSGNFSVLVAQITVKRYYEHYIFCTITPCTLLIIITYLIFWMKSINIRYFITGINLGLMIYIYQQSACGVIVLPYMKALDIYIFICIAFVFIALLENVIVDANYRYEHLEEYGTSGTRMIEKAQWCFRRKHNILDKICIIIYPILYSCIMVIYYYMFLE